MKTSLHVLRLTLMVFLSSDWVIQGTGALNCSFGMRCKGKECKALFEDEHGKKNWDRELLKGDCSVYLGKIMTDPECTKVTLIPKDTPRDIVLYDHRCGPKGTCKELEKKLVEECEIINVTAKSCDHCSMDYCNSESKFENFTLRSLAAPKSVQGLGLFIMTGVLMTVVILGL